MRRLLLAIFIAGFCAAPLVSQALRIAVADFSVKSDDPSLRYVGKGLAEMVAGELGKLKGVTVIARDERNEVLRELEFSLSGAAAGGSSAGKLLAADYLLAADVVDMGGSILLSTKLISVQTSEVVWSDQRSGPLADYGALSLGIALAVAKSRGLEGGERPGTAPTAEPKAREKAIRAFSAAVDALDRKDAAEAKRLAAEAAAADPGNAAVIELYERLTAPSPRQRMEIEFSSPLESPADLAFSSASSLGVWQSSTIASDATDRGDLRATPLDLSARLSLGLPLGKRGSLSAEALAFSSVDELHSASGLPLLGGGSSSQLVLGLGGYGADLGIGVRLTEELALGASLLALVTSASSVVDSGGEPSESEYAKAGLTGPGLGAALSLSYRNRGSTLMADFQASWIGIPQLYLVADASEGGLSLGKGLSPLLVEAGFFGRLPSSRSFLGCRALLEQYLDERRGASLRLLPGAEWWPTDSFGLRGSLELSAFLSPSSFSSGCGGFLGCSLLLGGVEIDFNATLHSRPSAIFLSSSVSEAAAFSYLVGVRLRGSER